MERLDEKYHGNSKNDGPPELMISDHYWYTKDIRISLIPSILGGGPASRLVYEYLPISEKAREKSKKDWQNEDERQKDVL